MCQTIRFGNNLAQFLRSRLLENYAGLYDTGAAANQIMKGVGMNRLLVFCAFFALAFGPIRTVQNTAQDDEATIRAADEAWAKAIEKKSIEEATSYYDSEAVAAGSAMLSAKGISAIRAMWMKYFAAPGFSLTWKADRVVVTESKTTGYSTGIWRSGTGSGPYFAVWRKQPDGKWKVLIDAAWYGQKPQ